MFGFQECGGTAHPAHPSHSNVQLTQLVFLDDGKSVHSKKGNRRMVLERRRKHRPLPEFNISIPTFAKVEKKIHKHIWV